MRSSATILQQQTIGDTATDWSQTVPFNQFDPSQGTLQSIGVGLTSDLSGTVSVESLEAAPSTVSISQAGNLTVETPTLFVGGDGEAAGGLPIDLAAYDGTIDYAGVSGTVVPLAVTGTTEMTLSGSTELAPFIGTGSVAMTAYASTTLDVTGPDNMLIQSQASADATVDLQYSYTPPVTHSGGGTSGVEITSGSVPTGGLLFDNAATTDVQTFVVTDSTTGWNDPLAINQFNPALGTLQGINVTLSGDLSISLAAENEGATSAGVYVVQGETLTLALPGAGEVDDTGPITTSIGLGGYDGTADYAGNSGTIVQSQTQFSTVIDTLTDATDLAAFTGTGSVASTISSAGTAELTGPGNLLAQLLTQVGGTVTVSYSYLPVGVAPDAVGWADSYGDGSGSWEDGTNWSSYPNPPASGDDVAITQSGTYTVTIDAAEAAQSIVIDAPGATLLLDANLTITGSIILYAGTIEFNGGTISAGNITMNGGVLTGDTVDLNAAGTIAVNGGLISSDTLEINTVAAATVVSSAMPTTLSDANTVFYGAEAGYSLLDDGQGDTVVGSAGTTLVRLSGSDNTFFGESGDVTVIDSGHNNLMVGGSIRSGFQLSSDATDEVVFGGVANVSMSDAGSNDTLVGSAGTTSVTLSGADATFFGESGAVTLLDSGHNDTLLGGSSQSTFQLTAGAFDELVFGGAANVSMSDAGSHDTQVGSAGLTSVSLSGADATFFGGSGAARVSDTGNGDTLLGGSSQSTFNLYPGATDELVFGGAAGVTMTDFGSHDVLVGSAGTTAVALFGSNATFYGESGAVTAVGAGHNDTLLGGSAQSTFQLGPGATDELVFGGTASETMSDAGSHDTAVGAAGTTAVTLSGARALFFGGAGSASVLDTGLNDTIVAGTAATAITANGSAAMVFGETGPLNFIGGAGYTSVAGGSGGATLFGGTNGVIHYSGTAGQLNYTAGSGNETLNASGSTTNDLMRGGLDSTGHNSIVAGFGSDTMVAGAGTDTLVGGSGGDLFFFASGNGTAAPHDLVVNFNADDTVMLVGYGPVSVALETATSSGGSTTITLSDNTTITFSGVASASSLVGHIV
jgi:Ca2+-binding RTX toxin-like protein